MESSKPDNIALPVADRWWHRQRVGKGIFRLWEPEAHELIQANAYFVKGSERDMLVDAGNGLASLRAELESADLIDKPVIAIATHSHFDHIGSLHEFDDRRIHELEAATLAEGLDPIVLVSAEFPDDFHESLVRHGMVLPPLLVSAAPESGFDPDDATIPAVPPTMTLTEGDLIDLGDRRFEVIHLPGHSPGQIGLWEQGTGVLFAGDAVYRGALLDEAIPGVDIPDYIATMRRLREMPVSVVYPGHEVPLDREEMTEIIDRYLALREPGSRPPTRTPAGQHEAKAPRPKT